MNEILISIMIFVNGVVIGIFVGYLLGRYRIKTRRVEIGESDDFNFASPDPRRGMGGYQPEDKLTKGIPPKGGSGVEKPRVVGIALEDIPKDGRGYILLCTEKEAKAIRSKGPAFLRKIMD